jgi:hypothetical protein
MDKSEYFRGVTRPALLDRIEPEMGKAAAEIQ